MELYIKDNISARHKTFTPQIVAYPPIFMAEAGPPMYFGGT